MSVAMLTPEQTTGMPDSEPSADAAPRQTSSASKLIALALFAVAAGGVYYAFGDRLSFDALAAQEQWLRQTALEHPLLSMSAAFLLYVAITGLSLPGAAVMTLVIGWLFGFLRGVLLVSFASTLGATLAFLFARYLFRDTIKAKFGSRLQTFEENLERDGSFYLFSLRLLFVVPFVVINLVMGLTPIKTRTYWIASQLGMLPGTMAYVYVGSTVDLQRLAEDGLAKGVSMQLLIALAILGLLPIVIKKGLEWFGPNRSVAAMPDESAS